MKNEDYVDLFLNHLRFTDPVSDATLEAYGRNLRSYLAYMNENNYNLSEIHYQDIVEFLKSMQKRGYAVTSIHQVSVSIRQFHQYLKRFGYLDYDPSEHLSVRGRERRLPKALSDDAYKKLMEYELETSDDYMDQAIFMLMAHSGLRVSEALSLEFSHYYPRERWMRIVGKGQKERMVPISKENVQVLEKYLKNVRPERLQTQSDRLFISRKGLPVSRQYVHQKLQKRKLKMKIDEPVSAHRLRHRFASSFLEKGVDLRMIQELLGHEDISTTQIYTHVQKESLKKDYDQYLKGGFYYRKDEDDEKI